MPFETWQKENEAGGFTVWQQQNSNAAILENDPNKANESAGQIWDMAQEGNVPLGEAEQVYFGTMPVKQIPKEATGLAKRLGKQLYNSTVAGVLHTLGKSESSAAEERAYELVKQYQKERFKDIDLPYGSSAAIEEWFNEQWKDWTYQLTLPPEARDDEYLRKEPQYEKPKPDVNPFAAEVIEAGKPSEKIIDAVAGITGFVTQIALLKKLSPSMPEPVVWETVNLASGGRPGMGAGMQATLAGIGNFIPGAGILPAVGRGTAGSILFGTTTYLGGGDTTEILINMGIPFAFEGMNITKQSWANYKNKQEFIATLKQKAPALQGTDDIVIDKAISDVLTNVELKTSEQMKGEFAPTEPVKDISDEVRTYLQNKRYDELLVKAGEGDKKAIRELNDWVQGTNLPTYEELLERGYNGDQSAWDRINEGNYYQGPNMQRELKIPREKKVAPAKTEQPLTPIEKMKAYSAIVENDIKAKPAKIAPEDLAKARERGFITSVKEVLPTLEIENQYIPRSTDTLAIKARNLIVDDLARAEQVALKGSSDTSVAVASELIKYYGERAEAAATQTAKDVMYERAAEIANNMANKLTELGRSVQAASILGRLTPEGQVRFAAREIQRYNEQVETKKGGLLGLRKKIPELSAQQAEYILGEMKEIAQMPDGKTKHIRFQKLQNHVAELVPTPMYQKIITFWKAGLLTGIKTHGLNIMANVFHLGTETAMKIPATGVDKIVQYFTGKRTVTPTIKGITGGGLEGMGKMLDYIKTGYSERDIGTKLDYKKVNMGKGNLAKVLQAYTDTVFRLLGAEDQPFYYAAKLTSMYEQAKVSAINLGLSGAKAQEHIDMLMQNPTEQMIKYASKDAETAVFINQTKLGDIARGIQKLPGGEVVVPFGRTPSAVAMQIVNYSPVGIVKTIIENIGKSRFDQRAFSQGLGRGITGTAVLVIGASLYKNDLITLDRPTTEKERKLWELEGRQPNSIYINGKWRTIQIGGPAGNLLLIGGHFQRAFEECGSPTEAMGQALAGSAKSFTEQTFTRGVSQFADALSDPERSAAMVVGNTISSIIPTIVADVARATDIETERRAETIPQKLITRIPGARETLEPQITVLGEEKKATANPLELMIDPTRPSKEISTPVITELRRLWDAGWEVSPSLLGDKKGYEPLTSQENTELWKRAGQITKEGLDKLIGNELYVDLPDEKKADVIGKLITESQTIAKTEAVANKLSGLDDKELVKMLFELRKSGLATEDIIPIALSKRKPEKVRREQVRGEDGK